MQKTISLILLASLAFSCGENNHGPRAATQETAAPNSVAKANLSRTEVGKEMFKSLCLSTGRFAELLPEYINSDFASELNDEAVEGGLNAVEKRHPGYFASLADGLSSGDPIRVAATIKAIPDTFNLKNMPLPTSMKIFPELTKVPGMNQMFLFGMM